MSAAPNNMPATTREITPAVNHFEARAARKKKSGRRKDVFS
jgi:hypothetical protein